MKFKINKGFIFQNTGKQITIFSGGESLLFTLNETAAHIFKGIKAGKEKEKIVGELVKKFGAKKDNAKNDLESFIEVLKKNKIVSEIK
jgi:hypothetical protein